MTIVGSLFILSSDDVSDLIINSVALAFIMDIDNQAKDFFQPDFVTEHIDKLHFETKYKQMTTSYQPWKTFKRRMMMN